MNNNISDMLTSSLEKIQNMVDVNTIIGKPITVGEGVTIIPVSKLHIGVGGGGTDLATKNAIASKKDPFGGGLGAGVSVDPVAFLVIRGESVRMLPVAEPARPPWTGLWSRPPTCWTSWPTLWMAAKQRTRRKREESDRGQGTSEK